MRTCKMCNKPMWEGYCYDEGLKYYCSEKCLRADGISEADQDDLYENDVLYWTDWETQTCDDCGEEFKEGELKEYVEFPIDSKPTRYYYCSSCFAKSTDN